MKTMICFICFVFAGLSMRGQDSIFTCDPLGVRLTHGAVKLTLNHASKRDIHEKLMSFIRRNGYTYKPYYSNDNRVAFRDFRKICSKSDCGSDITVKNMFFVEYDSGFAIVKLNSEVYSSLHGAELIINDNDDVASVNDVPFGNYEFQISEKYAKQYPESIFTFDKRGRVKIKNDQTLKVILEFYNAYIINLKSYLEN